MLTHVADGFLAVEDSNVEALWRSDAAIVMQGTGAEKFDVHAYLVLHRGEGIRLCHAAFHCRALKRALLYTVGAADEGSLVTLGQAALKHIGFQLNEVNLNLSPALRQVVLRDIPVLRASGIMPREQTETPVDLPEASGIFSGGDSDSAIAKRAASLRQQAERNLNQKLKTLREAIDKILQPAAETAVEFPLADKPTEIPGGLIPDAETLLEAERRMRMHAEEFLSTAEKRIQELERQLIEAETRITKLHKDKKRLSDLERQVKELTAALENAVASNATDERKNLLPTADDAVVNKADLALLQAAAQRQAELEAELADTASRLDGAVAAEDMLNRKLRDEQKRSSSLEKQLKKAQEKTQKNSDRKRIAEIADERDQVLARNEALADDVQRLQQEVAALHPLVAEQEQALEAANRQLVAVATLGQDLDRLRCDLAEAHVTIATEKQVAEELAARLDAAVAELEGQRQENAKFRRAEIAKQSAAGQKEIAALTAERDQSHLRALELVTDNEKLAKELVDARRHGNALAEKLQVVEQALNAAQALTPELDRLRSELVEAQAVLLTERKACESLGRKLRAVESDLERERQENRSLAMARTDAEKRSAALEKELHKLTRTETTKETALSGSSAAATKLLPHQLRPAPKAGTLFRPDWDLEGLPCRSAEQVVEAWESVYNVQLSLEGYPSQYCSAFMVVIEREGAKQLYFLFSLKKSKHTLVCLPSQPAHDDATFKKLVGEGKKFLKKSGFELEKIPVADLSSILGSYFIKR